MPDTRPPDDLRNWRLRDSDEPVLVVTHGTYGKPVIHREGCHTGPALDHPRLPDRATVGFDIVEWLWVAERTHRTAGHESTVEFCERCMCEPDD